MNNIKNAINDFNTFSKTDLHILYRFYNVHSIPELVSKIYKQGLLVRNKTGIYGDNYEQSRIIPYKPLDYYGVKEKKLGEGVYGSVLLYSGSNGSYAIKKMRPEKFDGIEASILREIPVLLRCNHPNIVPIIDVHVEPEKIFIVMPLASMDLSTFIKSGNLTNTIRRFISQQILEAFAYLENKDILHRDLKPQNILVYLDGNNFKKIEIADFGLSRPGGCINKTGLTHQVYTLYYRPLELLAEDSQIGYGTSADIWSIGCVLYELYTGKALWPGDTTLDMILRIFRTFGTKTPELQEDIKAIKSAQLDKILDTLQVTGDYSFIENIQDKQIVSIIMECLRYNPSKRPSAQELLNKYFNVPLPLSLGVSLDTPQCEQSFLSREWYPSDEIKMQVDINKKMLIILQDWLKEIWRMFKLNDRTFFVTCFILDWLLSHPEFTISRDKFQLVGVTAQLIAAKFCEVYAPEINDYVYITDKAAPSEQIKEMERKILKECNYDLIFSVSNDFRMSIQPFEKNSKEDRIHRITLMAITFCDLRFDLLPHEQNELGVNITKKIMGLPFNDPSMIERFKKEFVKISKNYKALEKYAILEKNLGESYYSMLNKL